MFFTKKIKPSMEIEIFEQAEILKNLFNIHVDDNNFIQFDIPNNIEKIVLVASGSSYHCARYAADLFGDIANIEARAIYSSEFLLQTTIPYDEKTLYIFVTQSGETTDTNKALARAKEYGVSTLCITNKKDSTIWQAADYKIDCHAGEEKSIAATKSLTTQMLCLTLLVLKFATLRGIEVYEYLSQLRTLSNMVEKTYGLQPEIKKLAKFLSKHKDIVVTADGIFSPLAKEVALKIKETSYVHTTAMILGEFMHGHVAILSNKMPLIYITGNQLGYTTIKNINKIKEDFNPQICIIGNSNDKIKTDFHINIDCEFEIVKSFCITIIAQILALEIAKYLKKNVDKPKGLQKVVI